MGALAGSAPDPPVLVIRGRSYPVLLPALRDPRLHLAAVITSLQVIGQIGFHFGLSIAQILISLLTSAALEFSIALWRRRVILWPASALLTGNGVAFVLRVPGTRHGDWWSVRGWWIFAGAAAISLLSKHVLTWGGRHVFNPSNFGLLVCFVVLGRGRADPLDFWWGASSPALVATLAVIVAGGLVILSRLRLLRVALGFWTSFAVGLGAVALVGHALVARWHLGPITGFHLWWVLVTSPEVLVFMFFMITDPQTAPRGPSARLLYAISLGLLAAIMIEPTTSEFAAKVALLGSLAIVCVALPALRALPLRIDRRVVAAAVPLTAAAFGAAVALSGPTADALSFRPLPPSRLPPITVVQSQHVQTKLDRHTAELIAHDLLASVHATVSDHMTVQLAPGPGQSPPYAVARLGDRTYQLVQSGNTWRLQAQTTTTPAAPALPGVPVGYRLTNVASAAGLEFRQDAFRYGTSNDTKAMMGGGLCWLDYNGDGWMDLFVVNSYSSSDTATWEAHGGLPTSRLFENRHGRFADVTGEAHAGLAGQGDGCAAGDLNGDGRTDLVVTTASGVDILWNRDGRFTEQTLPATGWYTGVAIADVNGDGRPDIFAAGYADLNDPVPSSLAGFPTNVAGVRDLLFLNEGGGRFREVGAQAGLEAAGFRHGLGAEFLDVNGDGRPDLYVANDEDPNYLYVNIPWPGGAKADPLGLGFRFEDRAGSEGVDDPFAGMGIASADGTLFVTNSRGEPSAAFRRQGARFVDARPDFDAALGSGFAGWGASWVDFANSGTPDLVLAAGAIPVTSIGGSAEPVRVLAPRGTSQTFGSAELLGGVSVDGRGLAAADAGNDGRMDVAVNTIGGDLLLLRPSGPSGNWLDVGLSRFTPGAVVTVTLPGGRHLSREVQAGSSYLSSEDPRVHFGLGAATRATSLTVRYPWGGRTSVANVTADRVVVVTVPLRSLPAAATVPGARLAACTPRLPHGESAATIWDRTAVDVLRAGDAPEPVQARDLYDLSRAMWRASTSATTPAARDEAIAFAAYRLLLWQASHDTNLSDAFGLLTARLRSLCLSPSFADTRGSSAAALGNRIAAEATAAGAHDGSNEELRYADPTYTPQNEPLVVAQAGSTVHDPTFWQPLALATVQPRGGGSVPAAVQQFVGSQWARVRTYALARPLDPGPPPFGDAASAVYRAAAVAAIRATAGPAPALPDTSPLAWNLRANSIAPGSLSQDVRLYLALNGALNDTAVSVYAAKRRYQSPRPISMVRYLAFDDQLPLIPGLVERKDGRVLVRSQGRWVDGTRWTPPAPTPPSPGWPSESSAFAAAAGDVLTALTGHSVAASGRLGGAGVRGGIETAADEAAGRALGRRIAAIALAR